MLNENVIKLWGGEALRNNWPIYVGQFLVAILIGGRDLSVGKDTEQYALWFERINDCSCFYGNIEPGFNILNLLVGLLSDSNSFYFFVISLTLFFMLNTISSKVISLDSKLSNSDKQLLFILIGLAFLFSPFFVSAHINAIRQGMASFLIFYAFLSFYEKSWARLLISSLLAVAFHTSSVMYLVLLPLLLVPTQFLLVLVAILSTFYAIGFTEVFVKFISEAFQLPLYEYVIGYQADAQYQSGVRYDFLIFSLFGVALGLVGRYFSQHKVIMDSLISTYVVLLIPFLMLGYANFSNRYAYTAWLFLSILSAYFVYSLPIWNRLKILIKPLILTLGQIVFLLLALNGIAR